ncbi:hypothetical protein CXB51_007445 [Gossypium anomalum]|uniref:Uncharacterized protein n=1 Tax=Gossypium anomalum TaxID=47600 RepID=A0A8J5Z013_9ROSI|nr:hypothetical protein CXB51_007445 [Gossypium anomalum]
MAGSNIFILLACFILLGFSSMEVSLATRNLQQVSLIEVTPITLSILPPLTLPPIDPPTGAPTDPPTNTPTLP